uniref:Uncharacterized protein n=1 Tax=Vespula pensylvanica TaxID=30213 RepID=A0A834P2S5_VESPE|nr:hypothetical protein H0235_008294 [Vespula pensylvanica]
MLEQGDRIPLSKDPMVNSVIDSGREACRRVVRECIRNLDQSETSRQTREYFFEQRNISSRSLLFRQRNRRRSLQENAIKINYDADRTLVYGTNDNLDSTCLKTYRYRNSIYFKTIDENGNDKENLKEMILKRKIC